MTGCKGLFAVKVFTNGIKVHSSTPHKGKSANLNMIKLLNELDMFYNENIKGEINKEYEVPYTTMNIGLLNGGSAINSVASQCMSYIDFRTIKNEHVEAIKQKLDSLCKKYDARYEIDIDVKTFYNNIDFLGKTYTAGFMTEASFIGECKRIILGVGPMSAHEINEHVNIESLKNCKEQYIKIVKETCNIQ